MISGVSARAAADPAAMEALSDACFGRVPTVRTPPLRLTTETSTKLEIQRRLKTETRGRRETVLAIIGRPRTEDRGCRMEDGSRGRSLGPAKAPCMTIEKYTRDTGLPSAASPPNPGQSTPTRKSTVSNEQGLYRPFN